jgi:hypothetical protein
LNAALEYFHERGKVSVSRITVPCGRVSTRSLRIFCNRMTRTRSVPR